MAFITSCGHDQRHRGEVLFFMHALRFQNRCPTLLHCVSCWVSSVMFHLLMISSLVSAIPALSTAANTDASTPASLCRWRPWQFCPWQVPHACLSHVTCNHFCARHFAQEVPIFYTVPLSKPQVKEMRKAVSRLPCSTHPGVHLWNLNEAWTRSMPQLIEMLAKQLRQVPEGVVPNMPRSSANFWSIMCRKKLPSLGHLIQSGCLCRKIYYQEWTPATTG